MSNLVRFNAFIILRRKATWGLTRKECMRKPSKTLLNLCVVRVTTELTPSLTWTDIVRSAKLWIQVPSITLATCATRRFLQRRTWPGTQNCTIELTMINQSVTFLALCARKLSWTHGIWKGAQRKTIDSQKLAMLFWTVWGWLYNRSTWLKETVSKTTSEKLPQQCDQCDCTSLRKMNLKRRMLNHNRIKNPEKRGRKQKNEPLSIFYLVNLERSGLPPVWTWNRHPHPLIYVWGIKIQSLTHRSEDEDVCFYWDACCQDHLVSFWK